MHKLKEKLVHPRISLAGIAYVIFKSEVYGSIG